jgi:membrane protease YdiL (CAAX protease family)
MTLLTLTPELHAYVVAAVAVYSLACAPTAALVQSLWPPSRRPPFLRVYVGTLLAVAVVAAAALRLPVLRWSSWTFVAVLVGLAAGEAAVRADGAIRRSLVRRRRYAPAVRLAPPPAVAAPSPAVGGTLALLLAVAALEEVLYRGVLVDVSLELPVAAAAVCIAATVVAFAAAHVYWGWIEMAAKVPLALAALLASLPFRALLGAIAAHVLFNTRSWLASR